MNCCANVQTNRAKKKKNQINRATMNERGKMNGGSENMLRILLVSREPKGLAVLAEGLAQQGQTAIHHAATGRAAMEKINTCKINVVIADSQLADRSGLAFIREITATQPFINCALVSSLEPGEFHEQTEGLGVFMQLPSNPDGQQAVELLEKLEKISALITA